MENQPSDNPEASTNSYCNLWNLRLDVENIEDPSSFLERIQNYKII